jgi:phage tail-like protein
VAGRARELHESFKFVVDASSKVRVGLFSRFGPIEIGLTTLAYREGGSLTPIKDPDEVTFRDAELARGTGRDLDFYLWLLETVEAARGNPQGRGLPVPSTFKQDFSVYQLDRAGKTARRWRLYGCWPTGLQAGDWQSDRDEVVIERLTLAYDWAELTFSREQARGSEIPLVED